MVIVVHCYDTYDTDYEVMNVLLFSFGYKHALPDADTVLDVRFLPNPYYVPELSFKSGLENDVSGYVLNNQAAEEFLTLLKPFLVMFLNRHAESGRESLRVAVGCTGGRHRSVAVAEKIREILEEEGVPVELTHRDINKE